MAMVAFGNVLRGGARRNQYMRIVLITVALDYWYINGLWPAGSEI